MEIRLNLCVIVRIKNWDLGTISKSFFGVILLKYDTIQGTLIKTLDIWICNSLQIKSTISEHIKNVFEEGELRRDSVVRKIRTTAAEGKSYETLYYNLDVIIFQHLDAILSSTGEQLLNGSGTVSHEQAMEKAEREYRQFDVRTLSPVEKAYLDNIKILNKKVKGKK